MISLKIVRNAGVRPIEEWNNTVLSDASSVFEISFEISQTEP